jgi:hypothetical protein
MNQFTSKVPLALFALLSFSFLGGAGAVTRSMFPLPGNRAIIMIAAKSMDGSSDLDGWKLFQLLNLPVQDSPIGPGKGFATANRDLNISCANRTGIGTECSLVINSSPRAQISALEKKIQYQMTDSELNSLKEKFFIHGDGCLSYTTQDNKLSLSFTDGGFELRFKE